MLERNSLLTARTWIRFGRLLPLSLWIGGIAFFAFAVAPVAFGRLPSTHEAGLVVGGTLRVLHLLGLVCGGVFILVTVLGSRQMMRGLLATECALLFTMLAVTAASQFVVLPAMEVDRIQAGGNIGAAAVTSPMRVRFERLHKVSEQMEGGVLLCGLALLLAVAAETPAQGQAATETDGKVARI